jgi:hypothetical protein
MQEKLIDPKITNTEFKIRKNIALSLGKKFADITCEYQQIQIEYQQKAREKMERKLKIGWFRSFLSNIYSETNHYSRSHGRIC